MLIQRSVLGEVISTFLGALAVTTGLAFFMVSIRFLQRTPGVGMGFLVELFPLFFPLSLQFTVPLSMLTAVAMAFNRIAGDGELTALAAAGVPLRVVARPVLVFASLVALRAFLLTDVASPFAAERLRKAHRDLPHQLQTTFRSGLCDLDLGRGRISFESFDGQEFHDVCVEYRQHDALELWRAKTGSIAITPDDQVVIALEHVQRVLPIVRDRGEAYPAAGEVVVERSLAEIVADAGRRRRSSSLKAWELAYTAARAAPYGRASALSAGEELARRSALAGSAFFFALIAIPLGVRSARGGRIAAFLFAVGPVLLVYFPLVITATNFARNGSVPAFPALWAGNAVLGVLGLALMARRVR